MCRSEWHGDSQDGIELRYQEDDLDEVLLYVGGRCVYHAERMDDSYFWMGLYAANNTAHINVGSVSGRANVEMSGEGWIDDAEVGE